MKYNLSRLMFKAWALFRQAAKKAPITFSEALRRAWKWAKAAEANRAKVEQAAAKAGIIGEYHSWSGWKTLGYEVIHGSKAAFQVTIDTPERGDGKTFVKSFFTYEQTQPAA